MLNYFNYGETTWPSVLIYVPVRFLNFDDVMFVAVVLVSIGFLVSSILFMAL